MRNLAALKPGDYFVQAVLNRYETYHRADGAVIDLPPDRGEGQNWATKPGNLYSKPIHVHVDAAATAVDLVLDQQFRRYRPRRIPNSSNTS